MQTQAEIMSFTINFMIPTAEKSAVELTEAK